MSIFLVILPVLVTAWIGLRIYEYQVKSKEISGAYSNLEAQFWPFLHVILSENSNLNVELIHHFPNQKNAIREYLKYVKGKKRKRLLRVWQEYESEYQQVHILGPFSAAVAIAPEDADLKNIQGGNEMIRWEIDRINRISSLIREILSLSKVKVWF